MNTSDRCRSAAALASAVLLAAMLLTAPSAARASEPPIISTTPADVYVDLANVRFSPAEITVRVGDTVTWTHRDSALSHHVGAHDGSFESHPTCGHPFGVCMKGGETFTFTFNEVGSYHYHCRPHSRSHAGMVGTVTVVE